MSSVVLLIVLPFGGAAIALLGKLTRLKLASSICAIAPLAAMVVMLVAQFPVVYSGETVVYELGGWREPVGIALHLDGLSWLSSALIVAISSLVAVASLSNRRYRTNYFFFLMLLVAGMETVVLTGDIFTMFVGFEIVAISAYVLIAFDQSDQGLLASLKYLMLSSVGILFFLFGVFLVYRDFGSLSLASIAAARGAAGLTASRSIHFAVAALCVGIGVRTAFIPFHTWLPEAHAYAPHPVSALLSGVLIKVSFFAMIRIIATFRAAYLNELLLWIGAVTALLAVIWALAQSDAKRLLAYHSISQMGYILAAFGAAAAVSTTAAFSHAVNHALFKSLLFLVAGTAISMTGTRDLYEMRPIGRRAPILAIGFLVGALSIAGVPPFNGFASKQLISSALAGHPAYAVLWVTSVATTASFIKISRIVMPGRADAPPPERPGFLIHVPVVALSLLCVAAGLFAGPLAALVGRLIGFSTLGEPGVAATMGRIAMAGVPSSAAIFAGKKLLGSLPILAAGVGLYALVVSRPGKRLAHRVAALAPELRTVLLFFVFGLVLFAVVAYV